MAKNNALPIIWFLLISNVCHSQFEEINGKIIASSNLEGVHVINKTSKFYTTTNPKGAFNIKATLNDTLVFSSVQYRLLSVKITSEIITSKTLIVELVDHVNQLDEVYIGSTLTGNLEDDIAKANVKPDINFYDVGIPGYTGKLKTKRERELYEADHGKYFYYYGIGFAINVHKILNRISGRTKMLKQRVKLEKRDELMYKLKTHFSEELFHKSNLNLNEQMDFFYFCSESENFLKKISNLNDLMVLDYLKEKLKDYKLNKAEED